MALGIPINGRNAITAAFTATIDNGAAGGTLEIRTGAKPALPNDAPTGTILATLTFDPVSFGAPSNGTALLDATPVITAVAVASGTAGWARIRDSNAANRGDITCGAPGSGADLILDNPVIAAGQTLNLTSGSVTTPTGG